MKTQHRKIFLTDTLLMLMGSVLCALAINGFLRPHELLSGGMAGTSLVIYYNWPKIPFALLYLLISIPVFIFGYFVVGRRFILFSVWAALINAAMFQFVHPRFDIPDRLLCALVGGALSGTGVALILRTNGTSSGTEIISIILNKFYSINIGITNLLINTAVMAAASFFLPFDRILYSFIFVTMNSIAMNAVFKGLSKRKAVMIISKRWSEILDELNRVRRIGVTILSAKGGYTGTEEPILYSVATKNQVSAIRAVTMRLDPAAFVAIMEITDIISDVIGNQPPWMSKSIAENRQKYERQTATPTDPDSPPTPACQASPRWHQPPAP
ncbi:MAG: YitT family protein [Chitinispirillales bacterium]|jgi:uncharacterized membrane-anchored protein YitT (DUF2179 family)|nr:YitT family protein [Chitinispirillales bacterium]